jgi:ATP-dependent Clp protease ATP-binding subunit ClpA
MTGVSGPRRSILHEAGQEAVALGHHWFGEEHVLLALLTLLTPDLDNDSARALAEAGLTHDSVAVALTARIERLGPPTPKEYDGALSAGSYHDVTGRAEGLALGTGAARPEPPHCLASVLWDDTGTVAALLVDLGVNRVALLGTISELGAVVPPAVPPNPLLPPAERQAIAREHAYIAEDDILLALLAGEPDDRAHLVLQAQGLTHHRAAEHVRQVGERSTPPSRRSPGVTAAKPNAACRELLGRAEGLAVTLGEGVPGSSDALIAYLWGQRGAAVITLERLSVSADRIVADLTATGVRIPSVPFAEPDRRPWGDRIFVPADRLRDIVDILVERLQPGTFGVNTHEGQAWVMAHADIDLQALVDEALSS